MSVSATAPLNVAQLQYQLGSRGALRVEGDPAGTGSLTISSEFYTDAQISSALSAITYNPLFGLSASQLSVLSQGSGVAAKLAQARSDAALFAGMTTADLTTAEALAAHQRAFTGWAELIAGLWDLLAAQGFVQPRPGV